MYIVLIVNYSQLFKKAQLYKKIPASLAGMSLTDSTRYLGRILCRWEQAEPTHEPISTWEQPETVPLSSKETTAWEGRSKSVIVCRHFISTCMAGFSFKALSDIFFDSHSNPIGLQCPDDETKFQCILFFLRVVCPS